MYGQSQRLPILNQRRRASPHAGRWRDDPKNPKLVISGGLSIYIKKSEALSLTCRQKAWSLCAVPTTDSEANQK